MGISSVMQVFSHTPEYWTNWNFELMMLLDEKSGIINFVAIYSEREHEYQTMISDILLKTTNVNLMALEEKSESLKSSGLIIWEV